MPDITMCNGAKCAIREECYRYTAKPDQHQSFMLAPWELDLENGQLICSYFIDNIQGK